MRSLVNAKISGFRLWIIPEQTEGTIVCACVRRTMRGVRELRDFSQTQN